MHRVVFDVAQKRKESRVVAGILAGKKQVVVPEQGLIKDTGDAHRAKLKIKRDENEAVAGY